MYIIYVVIYQFGSHLGTQEPKSMVWYAGGSCWIYSAMKLKRSLFARSLKVTAYCCTCALSCGLKEMNLYLEHVLELEEHIGWSTSTSFHLIRLEDDKSKLNWSNRGLCDQSNESLTVVLLQTNSGIQLFCLRPAWWRITCPAVCLLLDE